MVLLFSLNVGECWLSAERFHGRFKVVGVLLLEVGDLWIDG